MFIDLTEFGPWYGNTVSDIGDFKKSIEQIVDLHPKMGISSHLLDPVTTELEEQLNIFLALIQTRDKQILNHIGEGVSTVKELAQIPIIYPRIPHPAYLVFEEIMLNKHIELLSKNDRVLLEDGHLQVVKS